MNKKTHLDIFLKDFSLKDKIHFNSNENTIESYYSEIDECIKDIDMSNKNCKIIINDSEGRTYFNDFIESESYFKEHFISKENIIDNKSE